MEHDAMICPRCGGLRSECSDPDRGWYPQRSMCYASGALALTMRRLDERYRDDRPGIHGLHPTDGMVVWMSSHDLTPDDNFV